MFLVCLSQPTLPFAGRTIAPETSRTPREARVMGRWVVHFILHHTRIQCSPFIAVAKASRADEGIVSNCFSSTPWNNEPLGVSIERFPFIMPERFRWEVTLG